MEHPILFSKDMVLAILNGTKNQTRRAVKQSIPNGVIPYKHADGYYLLQNSSNGAFLPNRIRCPYGKVGDILWARESFYAYGKWVKNGTTKTGKQKWKFVDMSSTGYNYLYEPPKVVLSISNRGEGYYKRNSLFMPKGACRILLRITSVRLEKLQDISESDAINEGVVIHTETLSADNESTSVTVYKNYLHKGYFTKNAYQSYASLWRHINGNDSWVLNPYVWAIDFEVIP